VTAPSPLREDLDQLATAALVATCARLRPEEGALADPVQATKAALRVVACRIRQLNEESAWPTSGWPCWSDGPRPGC
jgi:transposase